MQSALFAKERRSTVISFHHNIAIWLFEQLARTYLAWYSSTSTNGTSTSATRASTRRMSIHASWIQNTHLCGSFVSSVCVHTDALQKFACCILFRLYALCSVLVYTMCMRCVRGVCVCACVCFRVCEFAVVNLYRQLSYVKK